MKLSYPVDRFLEKAAEDDRLLPSHLCLFMAISYYCPDVLATASFRVSRKKLMRFSRIKAVATYHKCIRELVTYGYISYEPSFDPYRASLVSINVNFQI